MSKKRQHTILYTYTRARTRLGAHTHACYILNVKEINHASWNPRLGNNRSLGREKLLPAQEKIFLCTGKNESGTRGLRTTKQRHITICKHNIPKFIPKRKRGPATASPQDERDISADT